MGVGFHLKRFNEDAPGIIGDGTNTLPITKATVVVLQEWSSRGTVYASRLAWMVLERVVLWKACRCSLLRFPDADARPCQMGPSRLRFPCWSTSEQSPSVVLSLIARSLIKMKNSTNKKDLAGLTSPPRRVAPVVLLPYRLRSGSTAGSKLQET
jgi:hypothetical protein